MKHVAAVILSGGQGSRLNPLTLYRCKPALSYGGRYRLIDIPISNAINSGCQKIFVVTQFLSGFLHSHILSTYRFSPIELLSAEEKPQQKTWFQGTADAVRQNLHYLENVQADYFLILSGDQLYHMDFKHLLQRAEETDADMVVSCLPVDAHNAKRMGIMKIDKNNKITDFIEKPQTKKEIADFALHSDNSHEMNYLGSMGIYLFKRQALIDLLMSDPREDFGKHLIPNLVQQGRAAAYIHEGYWEDIGTIESFYAANIALTHASPSFNCYNEAWPIFSKTMTLPGAKILSTNITNSLLCEGVVVQASDISHSVIGPRTFIKSGTKINDTYIMGNEFFSKYHANQKLPHQLHIGKHCTIKKAIIDHHVCIGDNVQLINKDNHINYTGDGIYIRDGIIVIPQGTSIPDHFTL